MISPLKNFSANVLFDAVSDAMLLVDDSGHVIGANPSALQLLEYTEKELLGLEVEALMPINSRYHHREYRDAFYKKPEKRTMGNGRGLFALTRGGKEIVVDIGLSPIETQGQVYILITFYLAGKRLEAEQAMRISEERLRLAKQAANFGIFDFDPNNKSLHWDDRMYELFGLSTDKPVIYEQMMATINPDDLAAVNATVEHAANSAGNGQYKIEYRIKRVNDGAEHWLSANGLMYFKDGKATRLVGVVQDITEHKILELLLKEHREETESMFKQQIAAHTASAIAHELNQPLAAISAYSDVALHALNDVTYNPEKLKHALEGCIAQAQRAGTSLHELLAFLQQGELITERFDLNATVSEALSIAKADGYKAFNPITHLEKNMPDVLANRTQVLKVLVNLLRNAVEAMRCAGVPDASVSVTVRTNKKMNMGHVTVQDSGPGISQDAVNRIFEPFFTTKPTGIGMGLAISRALIEANGGQLWLEPTTKSGAAFHFTLPFAPWAMAKQPFL